MDKRGITTTVIILIAIALLVVIGFGIKQSTGKATLTEGANYGPIFPTPPKHFNYIDCVYIGVDDGWSVLKKGKIQYHDVTDGKTKEIADYCVASSNLPSRMVKEFDCVDGYKRERNVECPPKMVCDSGVCVQS